MKGAWITVRWMKRGDRQTNIMQNAVYDGVSNWSVVSDKTRLCRKEKEGIHSHQCYEPGAIQKGLDLLQVHIKDSGTFMWQSPKHHASLWWSVPLLYAKKLHTENWPGLWRASYDSYKKTIGKPKWRLSVVISEVPWKPIVPTPSLPQVTTWLTNTVMIHVYFMFLSFSMLISF